VGDGGVERKLQRICGNNCQASSSSRFDFSRYILFAMHLDINIRIGV
jgi:hypothetical protein